MNLSSFKKNLSKDFPASIVVFLVALPLCLGIALASGAPLYSGIISGIIGGVVVGSLSNSALGVSGPAAGLAVIVLNAITDLGGFEIFLVSVILAGLLQLLMGVLKAGIIAYYFPSSVIKGMLAGIGILIFYKQIPNALGAANFEAIKTGITFNVAIITAISLAILLIWQTKFIQKISFLAIIPGALLAVTVGILLQIFVFPISSDFLVKIPVATSPQEFFNNFTFPDFAKGLTSAAVYKTAIVIAVVASLETLLCVEASDKQDPKKRTTSTNKELIAQGVGNMCAGLIGGLPVTQVIVRSSANQQAGGQTKTATIFHGLLLLISILLIPTLLNKIPLATLAAILLIVGYKLANPSTFKKMYQEGLDQFIPFVVTIVGIVATDLLMGIGLGIAVAIFIILRNNYKIPYFLEHSKDGDTGSYNIELSEDVTFLNKASVLKVLDKIPQKSKVTINATKTQFIHLDIIEIIQDFAIKAANKEIELTLIDLDTNLHKHDKPLPHLTVIKS
ncbi:MFS superfamily sulfate permease-like transporter [Wenyingzhuangia heitensis]|uniref:MFS superfamily sulfate permease-like transporter n=1 Tax=Wenyingzhuangia heitensis TaxID=1487859 RepID=A0ABX0U625_9FLAO|nr:SulP family inorganic anion transporter [Wenyingzhuangia heitensis]NIJ44213.1 MFS superfamily sulfate permease-like transporter [Wenyingzhuangia heitensis]